jgi:TolA-binding protein
VGGCAGSGADPLARDVARLQDEVRRLRTERAADRSRLEALEARVEGMSRDVSISRRPAIPPGLAVVKVEPGTFEDDEGSAFVVDVGEEPPARPRPAPRVPAGSTGGVDAAPPLPTDVELKEPPLFAGGDAKDPPVLAGPPAAFLAAEEVLRSGDARRAATLFEEFVAASPDDAYADNALVARGDALVRLGEPGRALAAYERAATGYPAGDAVPEALLRYGETCLSLGRKTAARMAFERVIAEHPGTAPAEAAKDRLAEF